MAEVEGHLHARGFAPATIAATLQALHARRYMDDAALAQRRAEDLLLRRGYGRLRVSDELTRRGVADSVIATTLAAILEGLSDAELARQALRRKFRATRLTSSTERARAFRFLTARGHPAEVVNEVLEEET